MRNLLVPARLAGAAFALALAGGPLLGQPSPNLVKAEAAFKPLAERFRHPSGDPLKLRQDLMAFRLAYPGTPPALEAAALLRQMTWPLDRLRAFLRKDG